VYLGKAAVVGNKQLADLEFLLRGFPFFLLLFQVVDPSKCLRVSSLQFRRLAHGRLISAFAFRSYLDSGKIVTELNLDGCNLSNLSRTTHGDSLNFRLVVLMRAWYHSLVGFLDLLALLSLQFHFLTLALHIMYCFLDDKDDVDCDFENETNAQ